jgi:hypothetical protein
MECWSVLEMMTARMATTLALTDRWKENVEKGTAVLAERNDGVGLTREANRRCRSGAERWRREIKTVVADVDSKRQRPG